MASLLRAPRSSPPLLPSRTVRGVAPSPRPAPDSARVGGGGGVDLSASAALEIAPPSSRSHLRPRGRHHDLSASAALELAILAQRYMLEPLAAEAQRQLVARMAAADVVPLLVRAQEECAVGATEAIFGWAITHYEEVHSQVDHWLGCHPRALPAVPRMLGERALAAFLEDLRTAMLHTRHGL